jgi:hypothetical protein
MEEQKPNPLEDGFAKREKRAGRQEAEMKRFFAGLSGDARRALRRAAQKTSGKKETMAEMMARVNAEARARR